MLSTCSNVVLESVDDFDCILRELLVQPFAELAVFSRMLIKKGNLIVDVLMQRLYVQSSNDTTVINNFPKETHHEERAGEEPSSWVFGAP